VLLFSTKIGSSKGKTMVMSKLGHFALYKYLSLVLFEHFFYKTFLSLKSELTHCVQLWSLICLIG